jgi:outer membrane lipoprotein SlyB
MLLHKLIVLVLATASLCSCRSVEEFTGNTPIVDIRGVNMARYEADLTDCQNYADQVQVGRQIAVGAVAGAAVCGVFGAVIGNSDTAQRGAGIGAVGWGARGAGRGLQERERVIRRCLISRGYRVLN